MTGRHYKLALTIVGGNTLYSNEYELDLRLQSLDESHVTPIFQAVTKRNVTAPVPAVRLSPSDYDELAGAKFTEMYPQNEDSLVDLLINEDLFLYLLDENVLEETLNRPKVLHTLLGDVLGGALPLHAVDKHGHQVHEACHKAQLIPDYEAFMNLEDLGVVEKDSVLSKEDEEAVAMMERLTKYDAARKQYSTGLLFKQDPKVNLDSNYGPAKMITLSAKRKSIQQGKEKQVNEAYLEQIKTGFAEKVPKEQEFPNHPTYCIPTHPVYKPGSLTTKTRIVMNASSKCRTTGSSLNDILYQGPTLLPDLVHILFQFRTFKYVSVADISKMFWKIRIDLPDADCLRFMWQWDKDEPITLYRALSVTFGVISAPFQAIWTVMHHCKKFKDQFPLATDTVEKTMYMDDVSCLHNNYDVSVQIAKQVYELFQLAGMQPHKWNSNCNKLLAEAGVPEKYWATGRMHKVLGVQWDTDLDMIEFDFSNVIDPEPEIQTKRTLIKQAAKIFDPLGLISPFTLKAKLLFQQCWREKIDWDDPLPDEISRQWEDWRFQVRDLEKITQPRLVATVAKEQPWLAIMADASGFAYGACAYIVQGDHSRLLFAKTRVAPLKGLEKAENQKVPKLTIARLELLASMIATRIAKYIKSAYPTNFFCKTCYFTDSLITLWRIRNGPASYRVWVANRVSEIRKNSEVTDWFFCPGQLNSADLSSRSATAKELLSNMLWWEGPAFLTRPQTNWPEHKALSHQDAMLQNELDKSEIKPVKHIVQAVQFAKSAHIWSLFKETSNWSRLQKKTAWIFKFLLFRCPSIRRHVRLLSLVPLDAERINYVQVRELRVADLFWVRLAQQMCLSSELEWDGRELSLSENSKLERLQAFVDNYGIIRATTRLVYSQILPGETTKPIILPKNSEVMIKYVLYLHAAQGHIGPGQMLYFLRRQFRLLGGKAEVRKILHLCTKRNCNKPIPLAQRLAPLPTTRMDGYTPWDSVAVDFFGPIGIKHWCQIKDCPHPTKEKSWGCIFTCMQTRAVHLELVTDMSTLTFLRALTRLIGRRGVPSNIWSDNAKYFQCCDRQLGKLFKNINWDEVKEECAKKAITWEFGVERAPHSNGVIERMVKTVKEALRTSLGTATLTQNHLETLLCEAEGIVNDRPLAVIAENEDDVSTITPSMLCIGRHISALPFDNTKNPEKDDYTKMWAYRKKLVLQFWQRWRKDYLLSNVLSRFVSDASPVIEKDQVVLLNEKNIGKGKWMLARVMDATPGRDGKIRRVTLRTNKEKHPIIDRHINFISLLEGTPLKKQQLQ